MLKNLFLMWLQGFIVVLGMIILLILCWISIDLLNIVMSGLILGEKEKNSSFTKIFFNCKNWEEVGNKIKKKILRCKVKFYFWIMGDKKK